MCREEVQEVTRRGMSLLFNYMILVVSLVWYRDVLALVDDIMLADIGASHMSTVKSESCVDTRPTGSHIANATADSFSYWYTFRSVLKHRQWLCYWKLDYKNGFSTRPRSILFSSCDDVAKCN